MRAFLTLVAACPVLLCVSLRAQDRPAEPPAARSNAPDPSRAQPPAGKPPLPEPGDTHEIIRALLDRSRLLNDVRFTIPTEVYRQYLRELRKLPTDPSPAPVDFIAQQADYQITLPDAGKPVLTAAVRLRVFRPAGCKLIGVLSAGLAWEKVAVNGQQAKLPTADKWLRFTPDDPGEYVIEAQAPLPEPTGTSGSFGLAVCPAVVRQVKFDSPKELDVTLQPGDRKATGLAGKGTHAQFHLLPRDGAIALSYEPAVQRRDRPGRVELRGSVAWNLDAGGQQLAADLDVAIVGGSTEAIELTLPAGAERVSIAGPDVRDTQLEAGLARVFLRGKIAGHTRLRLTCDLPAAAQQRLTGFGARDGHWSGGVLVVSNTVGNVELLGGATDGLRELGLAEIPASALGLLPGTPALAYAVAGRSWSAEIDSLNLGEFALRESIIDLAHFELSYRDGGETMIRADFEIRNRSKQFLRLDLPAGARLVTARVNDKPCPVAKAPGAADGYLLPLVRSPTSVKGLISFPVEVVILGRQQALGPRGDVALLLPRVDLPIAYAWCEAYLPREMDVARWFGPLRNVERYSSETATAQFGYGRGELAEGYKGMTVPLATPKPPPPPEGKPSPTWATRGEPATGVKLPPPSPAKTSTVVSGSAARPAPSGQGGAGSALFSGGTNYSLARNYYRAGKDAYDNNDFANAEDALEKARKLAPDSPEAGNADKLLGNIRLAKGKFNLEGREQKASGKAVQQEQAENLRQDQRRVQQLVESANQAVQAGRYEQARQQMKAVDTLVQEQKGLAQSTEAQQQSPQLRETITDLNKALAQVNKQQQEQLRQETDQLKAKGDYAQALEKAKRLKDLGGGGEEIKKELQDLTYKAIRQQRQPAEKPVIEQSDKLDEGKKREKPAEVTDGLFAERVTESLPPAPRAAGRTGETRGGPGAQPARQPEPTKPRDAPLVTLTNGQRAMTPPPQPGAAQSAPAQAQAAQTLNQPDGTVQAEVIHLKNADANSVQRVLGGMSAPARATRSAQTEADRLDIRADRSANAIVVTGTKEDLDKVRRLISELDDVSLTRAQNLRMYPLRSGDATQVARDLEEALRSRGVKDMPAIAADTRTNSLLISGEDKDRELVDSLISQLDIAADAKSHLGSGIVSRPSGGERGLAHGPATAPARAVEVAHETGIAAPGGAAPSSGDVEAGWYEFTRAPRGESGEQGRVPSAAHEDEDRERSSLTAAQKVTRVYDIRDLIVRMPNFQGPRMDINQGANKATTGNNGTSGGTEENYASRQELVNQVLGLITDTVDRDSWVANSGQVGTIRELGGQIVVTQTALNQKALAEVLRQLREIAPPQVERGTNIAEQQARGLGDESAPLLGNIPLINRGFTNRAKVRDEEALNGPGRVALNRFLDANYDWQLNRSGGGAGAPADDLARTLRQNLGQKVPVSSLNITLDAAAAEGIGIAFAEGNNRLRFATIDEAQFRTLMELEAAGGAAGDQRMRRQEAIVGTDALLSNRMTANAAFAADRSNNLNIADNPIRLAHERYILIDNGRTLTAVRSGAMRHWTEAPTAPAFAEAPQRIDLPRVGQMVKFEKTLVNPGEELVIKASYTWKGKDK